MFNAIISPKKNMFTGCMSKAPEMLQMHTTVTEAISEGNGGTITCTPIGVEPITYTWTDAWQKPIQLEVDSTQSEASNVPPGDYHINATDALGREAFVRVRVKQCEMPVVIGYQTENATTEVSRDGKITAVIMPQIDNIKYLWTTGAITNEPVLQDVKCGIYCVTLITEEDESPILFIHASKPAKINVGGRM